MIDGGLWAEISAHMGHPVDWQRIETGGVGRGIPDLNGCLAGTEIWIELKATNGWAVVVRPEQIGWAERRMRAGGRVFLMTRRRHGGGPLRGPAVDELWIHRGEDTRHVAKEGLRCGRPPLLTTTGGPSQWDWSLARRILFGS
jgi:hypothetical protein